MNNAVEHKEGAHPLIPDYGQEAYRSLDRRHRREKRFRTYGALSVAVAAVFLLSLLHTIIANGMSAFYQTQVQLHVELDAGVIDPEGKRAPEALEKANYQKLIKDALKAQFPDVTERGELRVLYGMVSNQASVTLQRYVLANPDRIGAGVDLWLLASSDVDMAVKGGVDRSVPEAQRRFSDRQFAWLDALEGQGRLRRVFNRNFFSEGDSRAPELAGIKGATIGSLLVILACILVAFPLGVAAAVYLEEFARKNKLTDLIEININNLAAVPSIVYGLLGLSLFIHVLGFPRSAAITGGLTLSLLILPIIVITARTALASVPKSIRDAAIGLGASPIQVVFHHTLPAALPGIMTGAILAVARAIGETAPLLMIGMVAFVADVPGSLFDPATALPVQIYLWADSPETGFREKTSAAIMALLVILVVLNAVAALIRKKFETKW